MEYFKLEQCELQSTRDPPLVELDKISQVEDGRQSPTQHPPSNTMADTTKDDHYTGTLTAAVIVVITTNSIALYNAVELLLLIFVTFKHWGGFYFWSLLIASFGNIPYSLGYLMSYFHLTVVPLGLAFNNVGWWLMVTGQSFVLYSRLHLVESDRRVLRAVVSVSSWSYLLLHRFETSRSLQRANS